MMQFPVKTRVKTKVTSLGKPSFQYDSWGNNPRNYLLLHLAVASRLPILIVMINPAHWYMSRLSSGKCMHTLAVEMICSCHCST